MARRRRSQGRRTEFTFSRLLADYRRENGDNPNKLINGHHAAHLEHAFGRRLLQNITEQMVVDYGLARQNEGAAPGVINDELHALASIFQWRSQVGTLVTIPRIWFVPDEAARARDAEQQLAWERRRSLNPFHGIPFEEHRGIPFRGSPAPSAGKPAASRSATGSPDRRRKVTPEQVAKFGGSTESLRKLGSRLGVAHTTVKRNRDKLLPPNS